MTPPTLSQYRYHPSSLDDVESPENYQPGGFHPVSIGDVFSRGRYRVIHKLGFGGASTVWLARDQAQREKSGDTHPGTLVTLKVLAAHESSKPFTEISDLYVPTELIKILREVDHPGKQYLQLIQDHFVEEGPNGSHLCLVYPLAGPSLSGMADCPGRVSGSKRLRGDLARNVARQVVAAVDLLHSVGIVHGDLTSCNILFRTAAEVFKWNDDEVYQMLGRPQEEKVFTSDGQPPGHSASKMASPIDTSRFCAAGLLEDIFLIDFATMVSYLSPEQYFDSKVGFASDVWALACVIFEIRAGCPLFEAFFPSPDIVLEGMVDLLGRFPDPWWKSWDDRPKRFDESGDPKSEEEPPKDGNFVPEEKPSIRQRLREIGTMDDAPERDEGVMIEKTGTRLEESEIDLLADLLEKMLKYRPEERITVKELAEHPWFDYK